MTNTPTLVEGGIRLSREEETALNIMLRREGGEHQGMPLFKLEWTMETSKKHIVPVCFGTNPCSYHLLTWEPPSMALSLCESALGEDTSKGSYNCVTHFVDENDIPFAPTIFIIEKVIPILKRAQETARAALLGERAIVERNRAKKREEILERQKSKDRAYDSYVESVLEDTNPAFNGNPMSTSTTSASKVLSDLKPIKQDRPEKFDFTIRRDRLSE